MKVLIIQHSAADSAAAAGEVLDRCGHTMETIRIDRGDAIPDTVNADAMMMFGGAASLTSENLPPWVEPERDLIRRYVAEEGRIMGICLGSQILASALGANVRRNEQPEVGWHSVEQTEESRSSIMADVFPTTLTAFQWHQDTFEIPPGATHLFRSRACQNQGFAIDDRVFGFQFHFEANERTVNTFLKVSPLWKRRSPFVQDEPEIVEGMKAHLPTQQATLERFISQWLAG